MDFLNRQNRVRIFFGVVFLSFFVPSIVMAGKDVPDLENRLNIYYFRSNFRCSNCYKIEAYTKEAIEKYFQKELSSGEVVYRVINVDEKENSHFVDDYQLYTKSVVLSRIAAGKECEFKNLGKIWEYLNSKEKFYNYIREEVRSFLNKEEEVTK